MKEQASPSVEGEALYSAYVSVNSPPLPVTVKNPVVLKSGYDSK
jgi:hypothetical protein